MSALGASVVRLTDLDDFITPGIACIKPVESALKSEKDGTEAIKPARGTIAIENDGRYNCMHFYTSTLLRHPL